MSHDDSAVVLPQAAQPPIFIGGQHRSGTTLMRQLLARHPHIACGPESNLFSRYLFRDNYGRLLPACCSSPEAAWCDRRTR